MRLQILLGKETPHCLTWIEGQHAFLAVPVSFPWLDTENSNAYKLKWEHNALKDYLWDVDIQIWTSHLHFILTMQQNTVLHPKTWQTPGKLTRACTVKFNTAM